jgi:arginine decarboxylase
MMMNQKKAPLYEALLEYSKKNVTKFHVPGHNYGTGLPKELLELGGIAKFDLSVMDFIDSLHEPKSAIKDAQELAAECFGSDHTFFLVNGSTCGVESMILATCKRNDKIIVPRNIHKSVVAGLVLSGARPVYLHPTFDKKFNMFLNTSLENVETALKDHPDAKSVLIVNPSQFGVCTDIDRIAEITHRKNKILLVDEAWGAHFKFHKEFPRNAMDAGADMAVQSTHKRLPCLSQASMLHVKDGHIDLNRIKKALQFLQTTSPSYILLASLDLARREMALNGEQLLNKSLAMTKKIRKNLAGIGFECYTRKMANDNGFDLDITNITIKVNNGFDAWKILNKNKVEPEFATTDHLTLLVGVGNNEEDYKNLIDAVRNIPVKIAKKEVKYPMIKNEILMSPNEVSAAQVEIIHFNKSIGRISAEMVCPYPPGIPLLLPGERITKEIYDYLVYLRKVFGVGVEIHGQKDAELKTIEVVREKI